MWIVDWYKENGASPAQEFLSNLDRFIKIRFVARLYSVQTSSITNQTEAEYLEKHLWNSAKKEIRIDSSFPMLSANVSFGTRLSFTRSPTNPSY